MKSTIHSRPLSAFTLVELLVVIAIIGILVALLLPAVQAAREAARRTGCLNNISQLALATHNYEFGVEHLPAGVINPTGPIRSEPDGQHVSWIVQILPYMEMRTVYDLFDQEAGAYAPVNASIRAVHVSLLWCPSFPGSEKNENDTIAFGTYAGCHDGGETPINDDNNGVLFLNSSIRYRDIFDGSSQTLLIGEMLPRETSLGWVSGTRATLRNTSKIEDRSFRRINDSNIAPPGPLEVGSFASAHPGIVNIALADGSCRALNEDTDAKVLEQLGNRADGVLQKRY